MTFEEWLGKDNQLGLDILNRKYRMRGEGFEQWLDRVSGGDEEIARLIREKKFLFGGRVMASRGMDTHASYFNCYSYGFVEDDFDAIMQGAKDIGMTFKAQGGQGVSLSKLRPKGTQVGKDYASDGIIPFMKLYNEVTTATSQGGARKGALLISLDIRHKEAMDFIKIKSQEGLVEKANLSLEIDDRFMEAVEAYYTRAERIVLHERRDYSGHMVEYDIVPIDIYKALCENAWDWGDPAVLFTERLRKYNLMEFDDRYNIETCNPCGEQPLPKHGACCLGSLNLSEFVVNPYTESAYFDTDAFVKAVHIGVEALDLLIDENMNRHPLKQQQYMSRNFRNIGLGVFGYATALMKLGLEYGSTSAIEWTDQIFGLMFRAAVIASNQLAELLGPYPAYYVDDKPDGRIFKSRMMKEHFSQDELEKFMECGLRNCSLLSIAPTGTIATMLGESGGCEPEFAIKYTRRTVGMTEGDDTYYEVECKAAREWRAANEAVGVAKTVWKESTSGEGVSDVGSARGPHLTSPSGKRQELPKWFVSARDIPWERRVRTQAAMQKHVDTGISSTVNLPYEASIYDVEALYLYAWKKGLKGITVFREGCKRMPILTEGTKKRDPKTGVTEKESASDETDLGIGAERPSFDLHPLGRQQRNEIGLIRKLITGCGSLHLTAFFNRESGKLREIFLNKGSSGGCNNFMIGLSRMASLCCKKGCDISEIVDQLDSCGVCPSYAVRRATKGDTSAGSCCPVAVGKALMEMAEEVNRNRNSWNARDGETAEKLSGTVSADNGITHDDGYCTRDETGSVCPICGKRIEHSGGCDICRNCGWSKCE